jgi:hypothetical protein
MFVGDQWHGCALALALDRVYKKSRLEQIAADKTPYYKALEAADGEWAEKKVDLSVLEKLLAELLANQLVSVHDEATGGRH